MRIGIKFCGGCNPRYDRVKLANVLKMKLHSCTVEDIEDNNIYDVVFVFSGCSVNCASIKEFKVLKKIYFITPETSIDNIINDFNFSFHY